MGFVGRRHHRAVPVDVPDRHRRRPIRTRSTPRRSTSGNRRTKAELARDQPRPDAARSVDDRAVRRTDHARSDRRRDLRDDLHARAVARNGNVIWAGSDDGVVHVTRDGGTNWTNVTPPDLPDFTRISLIDASPHDAGTRVSRRQPLSARRPRALRLQDDRLRQDVDEDRQRHSRRRFPRAIREDPKRKGLLFLGTETGIYVSFDDGAHWQSLRLELPVTPVHGIVDQERRPRHRHARPIVLRHGQHRRAAAGRPRDDQRAGRAVRSGGRDAVGVPRRRRSTTS